MSYLSKTDFIQSLNCQSSVWFSKHQPEKLAQPSEADAWRMQQGNDFEGLIRRRFPGGVLIEGRGDAASEQTKTLIEEGATCLFQATAIAEGCLAKADIIEKDGNSTSWNLLEVKSSTRVKDEHILDVAFQTWVFQQGGYSVSRVFVIVANNKTMLTGPADAEEMSISHDVTDEVREVLHNIENMIEPALEVINPTEPPDISRHPCRLRPKDCPSSFHCYPDLPPENVFAIPRIRFDRARLMYDAGIVAIKDIEDVSGLNVKQQFHVQLVQSGEPHIDIDAVKQFLDRLQFPLSFLDYETANPVIPLFDGYRPYDQIVFQFSAHFLEQPGADLQHHEFLANCEKDPAALLAIALENVIPEDGSVLVWNKSFEIARNVDLAKRVPELGSFFYRLNDRIVDLMEIVSGGHYVDPRFRGSASIKKVLPVLVPQMSYEDLEVNNGSLASLRWLEMRTETSAERVTQIRRDLLEYCHQDTLAMVELLKVFESVSDP